jgi:hypothetical protein
MPSVALRAELKPSRLARAYQLSLCAAAVLVAVFWIDALPFDGQITGLLWIVISGLPVVMLMREREKPDRRIVALQFSTPDWKLRGVGGRWVNWEWHGAAVLPFVVVLRLVDYKGRRFDYPVWRDQLAHREWRQLRAIATHAEFSSSNTTSGF